MFANFSESVFAKQHTFDTSQNYRGDSQPGATPRDRQVFVSFQRGKPRFRCSLCRSSKNKELLVSAQIFTQYFRPFWSWALIHFELFMHTWGFTQMCMVASLPPAKKLFLPWCSAGRLGSLLDAVRMNLSRVLFKFEHQCEGALIVILVVIFLFVCFVAFLL